MILPLEKNTIHTTFSYFLSCTDLLKSYISQRDEMNALKTEITQLETQLDSLNEDLERKLQEYESCNGGG